MNEHKVAIQELDIEKAKRELPRQLAKLLNDHVCNVDLHYMAEKNDLKVKSIESKDDKLIVRFCHKDNKDLIVKFVAKITWNSTQHPS